MRRRGGPMPRTVRTTRTATARRARRPHSAPHDAPPAMALALIVLAIGSVLAGYVGIPAALGGHNALGAWLAPSFAPPVAEGAAVARRKRRPRPKGPARPRRTTRNTSRSSGRSWACRAPSPSAASWWPRSSGCSGARLPPTWRASFAPIHRLLLNKYYVDELYDATIVQPVQAVSREGLWRGVDVGVIDGAVNGVGAIVDASSRRAAPAADRLGARLRRFAVHRRGADARLLPLEITQAVLLTLSWTLPLAGAILLALIGNADGRRDAMIRWVALGASLVTVRRHAADLGAVRPGVGRLPVRRARGRGSRPSASTTTSASTASACCWWCSPASSRRLRCCRRGRASRRRSRSSRSSSSRSKRR